MKAFTKLISEELLMVVLGPTASGKTKFSINLAKKFKSDFGKDIEIINADSRQLYKYLDIGTAKVTKEEMQNIPHHLIDVLDPKEEVSVGWYQNEAKKAIKEIKERGNVPMIVGGSMLYISSITDELSMAPTPTEELRKKLIDEYDKDQGKTLHKRLSEVDPEVAGKIHINNKPRLVRAMEVYELTKKIKSEVVPQDELRPREKNSNIPIFQYSNTLIMGIDIPREELHKRINERTKKMFEMGWIEEVRGLIDRGYGPDDPGVKSCGYREIMDAIESGELDEAKLIETVAAKTRQYARRQLTWWRGDERIKWLEST